MSDDTDNRTDETWVCAGRRTGKGNKILYLWFSEDVEPDVELYYGKVKGHVGGRYTISVDRTADSRIVYGTPRYLGALSIDDPKRISWEVDERVEMSLIEADRMETRNAKDSALKDACEPLRVLYRKQIGGHRRAAFIAMVIEMVTR